ncbi:MAG: hypothetical protein ACRC7I_02185 [Selenomonadaceae bacterium]
MRRLYLLLIFLLTANVAAAASPLSSGLAVDAKLNVIGVNLYGPAFYAGIRPGDQLSAISADQLYRPPSTSLTALIHRANADWQVQLFPAPLKLSTQQSIFLLPKNALTFVELTRRIKQDPFLASVLKFKTVDSTWSILYTNAEISSSLGTHSAYTAMPIPSDKVRITGVLFFTPSEHQDFQIFNINLIFYGQDSSGHWQSIPGTGTLQREILEHLLAAK